MPEMIDKKGSNLPPYEAGEPAEVSSLPVADCGYTGLPGTILMNWLSGDCAICALVLPEQRRSAQRLVVTTGEIAAFGWVRARSWKRSHFGALLKLNVDPSRYSGFAFLANDPIVEKGKILFPLAHYRNGVWEPHGLMMRSSVDLVSTLGLPLGAPESRTSLQSYELNFELADVALSE